MLKSLSIQPFSIRTRADAANYKGVRLATVLLGLILLLTGILILLLPCFTPLLDGGFRLSVYQLIDGCILMDDHPRTSDWILLDALGERLRGRR